MATAPRMEVRTRVTWWLMPWLAAYVSFCFLMGRTPDADKVTGWVIRASRWRINGGKWRRF